MKYLGIVLISILSMSVLLDVSPAAAKLSLAQLEHDHKSYRERLISSAEKKGLPDVAAALAQSKAAAEAGRGGEALRLLELAAGRNPDHYLLWIRLGQMWGDLAPLSADAQSAAYGAYLLAGRPEEEAEALFLLANLSAQSVKKLKESQTAAEDKIAEIEATINKSSDKVPDSGTSRTFTGNEDDLSESALIKLRCAQVTPKEKRKAESVRLTELYRLLDASLSQLCDANERIAEAAKTAAIAYQEIFTILKAQGDPKRYTGSRFPEIAKAFALKAKGASFKLSDSASAACFYFTMQLKPDVSLYKAKFVEVYREKDENNEEEETRFSKEPIQTDITIKRDELCVHGLSHGKTYQFLFKSGLPSGNGLELAEAVFIKARVPDRTATITFQSSAFIVPSHGERVIPMSTVNVQNVRLELFRISDRSLNQEIALGKFGAELDGKKLRELTDNFAELMWTGEKGIESRPNQSVITRLPMYEVLQARRAWVRSRNAPAASSAANANGHFSNGKFAGGSAAFQSSSTKPWEPGVFALIATLPSDQTPLQTGSGEGSFPVQWFIYTDIGLTYYKTTSKLYVIAHSLSSGKEISNVRVELVSANNRVLGSQNTDSNGVAAFDTRLANGEQGNRLAAILAYGDDDFSFLDFTHDNFDLSNYNVSGRSPPKGLDAYVYTDRGVYKPAANEPVNITVLLRDAKGVIPQLSAPLNLRIISSKTGTAIASAKIPAAELLAHGGAGGRTITLPNTTPVGTADVEVSLGDDNARLGGTAIQIAEFRPDRARVTFSDPKSWTKTLSPSGELKLSGALGAQYLYGRRSKGEGPQDAPAAGLRGEIAVSVEKAVAPFGRCYKDFAFENAVEAFIPFQARRPLPATSDDGSLNFDVQFDKVSTATSPLQATVNVSLYDEVGLVASKSQTVALDREGAYLGLRHESSPSGNLTAVDYEAIVLGSNMRLSPGRNLHYRLIRERSELIWFSTGDGNWRYREGVSQTVLFEGGITTVDAPSDCRTANARFPRFDLDVGAYRLEISDANSVLSSSAFEVGTSAGVKRADPQTLAIRLARPSYKPDEDAEFTVESPIDGRVMIAIAADDQIAEWITGDTANGKAKLKLHVPKVFSGRSFYAIATVFRKDADGSEATGPARAMGAAYFTVEQEKHFLKVSLEGTPYRIIPTSNLDVRIQAVDWKGENLNGKAYVSLYAVDEGIVNITSHPAPDPKTHFYGQRRIDLDIFDSYGRILLTRSGGDRYLARLYLNNLITNKLVSKYLPPIEVEFRDGVATLRFDTRSESFNGTLRLAAMVWTDTAMGADTQDLLVRDSIVAEFGLPRFIDAGDKLEVPLCLTNVEAATGLYRVAIRSSFVAGISIPSESRTFLPGDDITVKLEQNQRKLIFLSMQVNPDTVLRFPDKIFVTVSGADPANPVRQSWNWEIPLRSTRAQITELVAAKLVAPGTELTLDQKLIPENKRSPNSLYQVQLSGDSLPVPVASAGELSSSPRTLERLVWSGILMSQNASGSNTASDMAQLISDVIALQERDGSFSQFRKSSVSLEESVPSSNDRQATSRNDSTLWRTALAVDFLRLNEAYSGKSQDYYAGLRRAQGFLLSEMSQVLEAQTAAADAEENGRRATPAGSDDVPVEDNKPEGPISKTSSDGGEGAPGSGSAVICDDGFAYALLQLTVLKLTDAQWFNRAAQFCSNPAGHLTAVIMATAYREFGKPEAISPILVSFHESFPNEEEKEQRERDQAYSAMLLSFLSKAEPNAKELAELGKLFSGPLQNKRQALTLEAQAWLSKTMTSRRKAQPQAQLKVDVAVTGANRNDIFETRRDDLLATSFRSTTELSKGTIKLRNTGSTPITATAFTRSTSAPSLENNPDFSIRKRFFDKDGMEIDTGNPIGQNETIFVVIEGKVGARDEESVEKLLIVDELPSSFELIKDNAYTDGRLKGEFVNAPLPAAVGNVEQSDIRDDRYIAIVRPANSDFRIAYAARPLLSGELVLRPVTAEYLDAPQFTVSSGEAAQPLKVVAK